MKEGTVGPWNVVPNLKPSYSYPSPLLLAFSFSVDLSIPHFGLLAW